MISDLWCKFWNVLNCERHQLPFNSWPNPKTHPNKAGSLDTAKLIFLFPFFFYDIANLRNYDVLNTVTPCWYKKQKQVIKSLIKINLFLPPNKKQKRVKSILRKNSEIIKKRWKHGKEILYIFFCSLSCFCPPSRKNINRVK